MERKTAVATAGAISMGLVSALFAIGAEPRCAGFLGGFGARAATGRGDRAWPPPRRANLHDDASRPRTPRPSGNPMTKARGSERSRSEE